jgi:hypothetical protein
MRLARVPPTRFARGSPRALDEFLFREGGVANRPRGAVMTETQTFLLTVPKWRAQLSKQNRWVWVGMSAFLGIASVLALYATVRDYRVGVTGPIPPWAALVVFVVFMWGFLTTLTAGIYNFWQASPTRLAISSEGLEIEYPPGVVKFRRRWSDPRFSLILRDFRGRPGPASQDLVLDTGDHTLVAWLLPSTKPPSAYLSPEAFEAIVKAGERSQLAITHRKGSSAAWAYFNEEIQIHRAAG